MGPKDFVQVVFVDVAQELGPSLGYEAKLACISEFFEADGAVVESYQSAPHAERFDPAVFQSDGNLLEAVCQRRGGFVTVIGRGNFDIEPLRITEKVGNGLLHRFVASFFVEDEGGCKELVCAAR